MENLIGQKFNMLTVVAVAGKGPKGLEYECLCDCGRRTVLRGIRIAHGEQKSCGCLRRKHGWCPKRGRSPEWRSWVGLKGRCENPNNGGYQRYGARGIKICERWRKSFKNFIEDMGPCPPGYQIDRIDNDGDYEPNNCRWVSRRENVNNRRCSIRIEMDGQIKPLTEWCEIYGAPYSRTLSRLSRGWDPQRAIKAPSIRNKHFWAL